MWPFTKKTKTPDRLPIDGPWSVGQGQHDGKILIVRSNTGYKEYGSVAGYDHQVGIAVPLRAPEPTGLPSPQEDAELGALEDTISASLEQQAESLLVAIITTSGMRELVFYTRAPEQVKQHESRDSVDDSAGQGLGCLCAVRLTRSLERTAAIEVPSSGRLTSRAEPPQWYACPMGVCSTVAQLATAIQERYPAETPEQRRLLSLLVEMGDWMSRKQAVNWDEAVMACLVPDEDMSVLDTLIYDVFAFAIYDFYGAFDEIGRRSDYERIARRLAEHGIRCPRDPDLSHF
jgi:hypothetical protein